MLKVMVTWENWIIWDIVGEDIWAIFKLDTVHLMKFLSVTNRILTVSVGFTI